MPAINPYIFEPGYFCVVTTRTYANESVYLDLTTPQSCNKGFYCSRTGDGPCAPGEFCPTGSIRSNTTRAGYHDPYYGRFEEWICMPGTHANNTNLDTCDICPIVTQCPTDGFIFPKICPQGTYRSELENIECGACPDGTYANDSGLASLNNCTLRNSGWVCGSARQRFHSTDEAFLCPAGFVCTNGTNLYRSRKWKGNRKRNKRERELSREEKETEAKGVEKISEEKKDKPLNISVGDTAITGLKGVHDSLKYVGLKLVHWNCNATDGRIHGRKYVFGAMNGTLVPYSKLQLQVQCGVGYCVGISPKFDLTSIGYGRFFGYQTQFEFITFDSETGI